MKKQKTKIKNKARNYFRALTFWPGSHFQSVVDEGRKQPMFVIDQFKPIKSLVSNWPKGWV